MDLRTYLRDVIRLLRAKIADPRGGRGQNWIFPSYPEDNAVFPIISVIQGDPSAHLMDMIENTYHLEVPYTITVWVDRRDKFTVGNETLKAGALVDYLFDRVVNVMLDKNNLSSLTDAVSVRKFGGMSRTSQDPDNPNILYRSGLFEITYVGGV